MQFPPKCCYFDVRAPAVVEVFFEMLMVMWFYTSLQQDLLGKGGVLKAGVSGSVAGKRLDRASSAGAKVTPPATGDKRPNCFFWHQYWLSLASGSRRKNWLSLHCSIKEKWFWMSVLTTVILHISNRGWTVVFTSETIIFSISH